MKKLTLARRIVLGLIALLVISACAGSTAAPKAAAPIRGGTLTVAIWQEPNTLNPLYGTQTVAQVVWEVAVEGLVRSDPEGNYIPILATQTPTLKNGGVKLNGTRLDVTYKLQSGVKWSDGQPFSSADVKFTWETILKDPKVTTREGYDKIDSVDTPDSLTVVLHYKEVYAPYASRFQWLLPKHLLDGVADISKSDYVRAPLGTGPFKITEFKSADHITAERNPNYREKDKPYLDKVIFRSVPSREVALAQLKAGEVDVMWNLLESQLLDIEKNADIKLQIALGPTVERLEFNLAKPGNPADPAVPHPVLGDAKLREALVLATPKQRLIDKLLAGKAKPGDSPISIGFFSPAIKQEEYDPKKAKSLLDAAGWTAGGDGIRSKAGVRAHLAITTTTGDKVREQVEQVLVDEWKQIGVELEIKNVPSSVLFGSWSQNAPRKRGNFDVNMYASSPDPDPHETISGRFSSTQIPTAANNGAGFNYNRFVSADVDKLITQAGQTADQDARKKLYGTILKDANDAFTNVWLYNRSNIDGYRTNVGGYAGNGWDNLTWNSQNWYVKR